MAEPKTKATDTNPVEFINSLADESKRKDSFKLLELFSKVTGEKPKMWGTSIIGYGVYHLVSKSNKKGADWPLIGFSPRKQNLTLYVMLGLADFGALLKKLGKNKTSKGCLYINKLSDVDMKILEEIIKKSFSLMKKKYNA